MQGAFGAVTLITYNVSMSTIRMTGFHWYKPAILSVDIDTLYIINVTAPIATCINTQY